MSKSGSHLEKKPSITIDNIGEHPHDAPEVDSHDSRPALMTEVQIPEKQEVKEAVDIDDTVFKKKEESEVKVSDDGIKKEEQAMADEKSLVSKDPRVEIQEKNEEIQELKESKDKLEKEVLEMKEELVKQNKETQQLVLQKFDEIAEKVDKIEKQSLESGPSAKEKPPVDEQLKVGESKPVLKQPKLAVALEKAGNISPRKNEPDVVKHDSNKSNVEIAKEQEAALASENRNNENLSDLLKLEDRNESQSQPEEPLKHEGETLEKVIDLETPKSVEKAPRPETRVDPIVKLLKSQEPLSYQVGEKMMEKKKFNASSVTELVKIPDLLKHDSVDDEIKNEMRKKRDTLGDPLDSLENPLQSFELKSMISRDLKATSDEE